MPELRTFIVAHPLAMPVGLAQKALQKVRKEYRSWQSEVPDNPDTWHHFEIMYDYTQKVAFIRRWRHVSTPSGKKVGTTGWVYAEEDTNQCSN